MTKPTRRRTIEYHLFQRSCTGKGIEIALYIMKEYFN